MEKQKRNDMKKMRIKEIEKIIDQISGSVIPKYQLDWLIFWMDEEAIQKKYGDGWENSGESMQNYYRAKGYVNALLRIVCLQEPLIKSAHSMKEQISLEILDRLEKAILLYPSHQSL